MAVDEMQDAVMRAAEAVLRENRVGAGGEIAVGEEQELGAGDELLVRKRIGCVMRGSAGGKRRRYGARVAAPTLRYRTLCQSC